MNHRPESSSAPDQRFFPNGANHHQGEEFLYQCLQESEQDQQRYNTYKNHLRFISDQEEHEDSEMIGKYYET